MSGRTPADVDPGHGRDSGVPDAELVARAHRGDDDAFRVLVERHLEAVRQYAERRLPARVRARVAVSDVLQEAQIAALARCGDFEDRGSDAFRSWFLGIVEQKIREAVRMHERTAKRSVFRESAKPRNATGWTRELRGREPSPSQAAIGAETADLAEIALARLPDDYREILRLTRLEGLAVTDAAERMGRTPDAAKKLLSRALVRLAEEFERVRKGSRD